MKPYAQIPDCVVAEYLHGSSAMEIAERYGTLETSILNFLKARGVTMKPKGRPLGSKDKVPRGPYKPRTPKAKVVWRRVEVPAKPVFRSGICACGGKGYFLLGGKREKCPRCQSRKNIEQKLKKGVQADI